jgi:hypothetical protein
MYILMGQISKGLQNGAKDFLWRFGYKTNLTNISILPTLPHFQNPKNLAILYAQEKRKTVQ